MLFCLAVFRNISPWSNPLWYRLLDLSLKGRERYYFKPHWPKPSQLFLSQKPSKTKELMSDMKCDCYWEKIHSSPKQPFLMFSIHIKSLKFELFSTLSQLRRSVIHMILPNLAIYCSFYLILTDSQYRHNIESLCLFIHSNEYQMYRCLNKSVEQMIQLLSHEDHPLFHSWMADLICRMESSYTSYNELFKVKAFVMVSETIIKWLIQSHSALQWHAQSVSTQFIAARKYPVSVVKKFHISADGKWSLQTFWHSQFWMNYVVYVSAVL